MTRVAVAGSRGFIGSAVISALAGTRAEVIELPSLRVNPSDSRLLLNRPVGAAGRAAHGTADLLDGVDVVVNAAGVAVSTGRDRATLAAGNTHYPVALARLAIAAGVRRFIHVSSAAVQGRLDPLDESERLAPFSPYSRSKAEGERRLLAERRGDTEIVIYRATSVLGLSRPITHQLARYARLPRVPLVEAGSRPLPVALLENAAAAIAHLVFIECVPNFIALHPWEGMTVRSLLRAFGWNGRPVTVPPGFARGGLALARGMGGWSPVIPARLRSVELMTIGQRQSAHVLAESGFVLPSDRTGYEELARSLGASQRGGD